MATRLEFYSNREEEEKKKEKDVQFEHGYRLGFMDGNKVESPEGVSRSSAGLMEGGKSAPGSIGAGGTLKGFTEWQCEGEVSRWHRHRHESCL